MRKAARASWVGPSRHLRWENEVIVLGFGKHMGMAVAELAAGPDRSFLQWVLGKDFPPHVMEICKAALERSGEELHAWVRTRDGQPAPTAQPPFIAASAPVPSATSATAAPAAPPAQTKAKTKKSRSAPDAS